MKQIAMTLVPLLLALGSAAISQTVDGFQEFAWGTPPDEMKARLDLSLFDQKGNSKMYAAHAVPSLGNAQVALSCFFYKNKFAGVLIHTKGGTNSRALFEYLKQKFGPPERVKFGDALAWHFPNTTVLFNNATDDIWGSISSVKIHDQQKRDEAAAARKSTKKF